MAIKICTTDVRRVGKFFGNVYAVNTLGAIIGSFMAGFILIPWLGAQNSIFIAVTLNLGAAGMLCLYAPSYSRPKRLAGALATLVVALSAWSFISSWDPFVLTSGTYLYADRYKETAAKESLDLEAAIKEGRQKLYFKEGLHAVVSVEKTVEGDLALEVNGKTDATAKGDAATQLMVGHLPLLFHQAAKDVLVIGLGSGMTVGAVEQYPVKAIDVVEIEPAVVEASRYFREYTGDALNDHRVNLIVGDGRNHLALTRQTYDVIISEPSNPWVSGMANLFTREFFQLAKERLRKQGLMCQWVHAYSMSSVDFKTIVRTFHTVFPHTTVWEASLGNDYLLIGSREDMNIDPHMLTNRLDDEMITADLRKMQITDLASFFGKLLMAEQAIPRYTKGAPLHTDGNGLLAYSAPRALLENTSSLLVEELYRYRSNPVSVLQSWGWAEVAAPVAHELPEVLEARKKVLAGFTSYVNGAVQDAIQNFEAALLLRAKDYDATHLLAEINLELGGRFKDAKRPVEAARSFKRSINVIDNFVANDRALLSDYFALEVIYARAHLDLGVMALKANRLKQAAAALQKSVSGEVHFAEAHNNLGVLYEKSGHYDKAVDQYQQALAINQTLVSARMNIGNILLRQENYQEAIESYLQVQKLKPDFAVTNYNLGVAYFKKGEWKKAEREWMHALALNPRLSQAQQSLDVVRSKTN